MGCGGSKKCGGESANDIDEELRKAAKAEERHAKVLLLGAGESGKSTVGKQLMLLTNGALSSADIALHRRAVRHNLVECMINLLDAAETLGIPLANPELEVEAERVRGLNLAAGDITPDVGRDVQKLWHDEGIQQAWANKDKFWILDNTPYYMQEALRVTQDKFDVTEEDIIMTRVMTSGVSTIDIPDPPMSYTVVDVGGQRNERRKWMHCFDDVKAVVFVLSLAGYNQVMFEDINQNRLLEALELYERVVSNPSFRDTPVHVFLNKTDLFEEMIRHVPLSVCFPEYSGRPGDASEAISFVEGKCREIMGRCCPEKKGCIVMPICARRRADVKSGWKEVADTLRVSDEGVLE